MQEKVKDDTVSRQAAIDAIKKYMGDYELSRTMQQVMLLLPSAQPDVPDINVGDISTEPEIIRCKDCKYSEKWYRDKSRCFLWNEDGIDVFDAGFCNYAERRTDEQTD